MEGLYEIEFNKPAPFNPNKNSTSVDWQLWKKNFLIYLELTKARLKFSDRELALLLLNFIGPVGIEAKENMIFDDLSEEENLEILLEKFDEIFSPGFNEMEERYKFFSRRKYDAETVQNYVKCLREQAAKCNFGKHIEKFILDMVVLSMDYNVQLQTFLTKDLSLPKAIKLYEENLIKEEKIRNIYGANYNNELLQTDDLTDKKKTNYNFSQNINDHESKVENIKTYEQLKKATETKSKSTIKQNDQKDLQHCLWCGLNHNQGQCQHNSNCTVCDKFPHTVCFNCKKNPHEFSCYYKSIITLPSLDLSSSAQFVQSGGKACGTSFEAGHYSKEYNKAQNIFDPQRSSKSRFQNQFEAANVCSKCGTQHELNACPLKRVCFRCNTQHPPKQCPAFNVICSYCDKLGHFARACKTRKNQEPLIICSRCKMTNLEYYNEEYVYCKHCNAFFVIEQSYESSDDSSARTETKNRQPKRRNRRGRRNKQDESCSIS